QTEAFRNLVRLHVERDKFRSGSAPGAQSRQPRAIGIIGGGSRGVALIQMAVARGYQVVIREATDAALGNTLFRLLAVFQQEVARGSMSQAELTRNLRSIHGTTAWKGFDDLDLVLDVGEDEATNKKALLHELERQIAAD